MVFRGFEFAAVFAQFRRNKIERESAIQIRFLPNRWDLNCRLSNYPPGSGLFRSRIGRQARQPVFIQGPAALQRAAAHLDVVFLAPGEVIERERILVRVDDAKIALNA